MPDPKLELPPIGRPYISGYDQADRAFPIVSVRYDPNRGAGQIVPVIGSPAPAGAACPGTVFPTGYFFVGAAMVSPDVGMVWTYRILPGPTLTADKLGDAGIIPPEFSATSALEVERTDVILPTAPAGLSLTVLESSVTPTSAIVGKLETTIGPGSYPPLTGQRWDPIKNIIWPIVKEVVPSGTTTGDADTEITPLSAEFDLSVTTTIPTAALAAFIRVYPGLANIEVPPVLTAINTVLINAGSAGTSSASGTANASGTNWSEQLDIPNSNDLSLILNYEILPEITYFWGRDIPVIDLYFFLAGPSISMAGVLAACSAFGYAASIFPAFDPAEIVFIAVGQSISARAVARANGYASAWENASATGGSTAAGSSEENSADIKPLARVYTIPPTLHAAIDISTSTTATISPAAASSISGSGFSASASAGQTITATAGIVCNVGGTTVEGVPTTGLALVSLDCDPATEWGYIAVRARVMYWSDYN